MCSQFLNYFFLKEIDEYIVQAKERSYETMVSFGKQGLSIAATAAVSAAVKASYCYIYIYLYFLTVLYDFYLYHLLKIRGCSFQILLRGFWQWIHFLLIFTCVYRQYLFNFRRWFAVIRF